MTLNELRAWVLLAHPGAKIVGTNTVTRPEAPDELVLFIRARWRDQPLRYVWCREFGNTPRYCTSSERKRLGFGLRRRKVFDPDKAITPQIPKRRGRRRDR